MYSTQEKSNKFQADIEYGKLTFFRDLNFKKYFSNYKLYWFENGVRTGANNVDRMRRFDMFKDSYF